MRKNKRDALAKKGWKIGATTEFLNLSDEELGVIELKLALGGALKARRKKKKLTQLALARVISSSQSRVAKMEAGDPSVSLDLLVKSMLALGATQRDVANAIVQKKNADNRHITLCSAAGRRPVRWSQRSWRNELQHLVTRQIR